MDLLDRNRNSDIMFMKSQEQTWAKNTAKNLKLRQTYISNQTICRGTDPWEQKRIQIDVQVGNFNYLEFLGIREELLSAGSGIEPLGSQNYSVCICLILRVYFFALVFFTRSLPYFTHYMFTRKIHNIIPKMAG